MSDGITAYFVGLLGCCDGNNVCYHCVAAGNSAGSMWVPAPWARGQFLTKWQMGKYGLC